MKGALELHFIIGTYRDRLVSPEGEICSSFFFALSFQEAGEIHAAFDSSVWDQFHRICIHPRASEH